MGYLRRYPCFLLCQYQSTVTSRSRSTHLTKFKSRCSLFCSIMGSPKVRSADKTWFAISRQRACRPTMSVSTRRRKLPGSRASCIRRTELGLIRGWNVCSAWNTHGKLDTMYHQMQNESLATSHCQVECNAFVPQPPRVEPMEHARAGCNRTMQQSCST